MQKSRPQHDVRTPKNLSGYVVPEGCTTYRNGSLRTSLWKCLPRGRKPCFKSPLKPDSTASSSSLPNTKATRRPRTRLWLTLFPYADWISPSICEKQQPCVPSAFFFRSKPKTFRAKKPQYVLVVPESEDFSGASPHFDSPGQQDTFTGVVFTNFGWHYSRAKGARGGEYVMLTSFNPRYMILCVRKVWFSNPGALIEHNLVGPFE